MPFRRARENASDSDDADSKRSSSVRQRGTSETSTSGGIGGRGTLESVEGHYAPDAYPKSLKKGLYRQTNKYGPERVSQWAEDGVPVEIMGKPRSMDVFRERQEARPPEVPTQIEQQNEASVHRSKKAQGETDPSGDIGIPGSVRDVISSAGTNLDGEVRSGLEDRLGTSLDHVQVHTGPKAQQACEEVNARAFAVGNHIAFGPGEYNPSSAEGQHLIAHEVVHTLQQPDAEMSMLPKAELDVEIDPDPKAEREADKIAGEVMKGGEVGMTKSWQTDVHIQRLPDSKGAGDDTFHRLSDIEIASDSDRLSPQEHDAVESFLRVEELTGEQAKIVSNVFDISDIEEVRKATDRVSWIKRNHNRVSRTLSGLEANEEDRYPDWYEDPHDPNSLVVEFVTSETEDVEMLRAHGEENQNRYWLIPPEEVGGISPDDVNGLTAEDVQEALALPEPPKYLSKVIVPAKTAMRISSINENFGNEGTWPQAELEERLDDDAYEIIRTFEEADTLDEGDLK